MKPLALALTLVLGLICGGTARGGPAFIVFDGTTSPSGRYAFAWGLPEKYSVDWEEVRKGASDPFASVGRSEDPVENYLVDLEAKSVLARVPEARAWTLPNRGRSNHRDLEVRWSKDSNVAVALYSVKWGYGSFTAFRIAEGKVLRPIDLGRPIEGAWRNHLQKTLGDRYRARKDEIVVSFDSLKAEGNEIFSVQAYAEVPKSDASDDLFPARRIRFSVSNDSDPGLPVKGLEVEGK